MQKRPTRKRFVSFRLLVCLTLRKKFPMNAPLLYRPSQRWPIWAAFASAVLIHVAAVALAGNESRIPATPFSEDEGVEGEWPEPSDTPPPLPESEPLVEMPPPLIETDPVFETPK